MDQSQRIFRRRDINLVLGDFMENLESFVDRKADTCITDPPYNISGYDDKKKIGWLNSNSYWTEIKNFDVINEKWDSFSDAEYQVFTYNWLKAITSVVKENGNILIFGTYHNIFTIGKALQDLNKKIGSLIVWYKRNAFPNITQRGLCESAEFIIWAINNNKKNAHNWYFDYKTLKKINKGKQMRNVWDIPYIFNKEETKFGKHPAQKPLSIIDRLVLGFSQENSLVVDPFFGSGTTAVSCTNNKRRFWGTELSEKYFKIAQKRVSAAYLNSRKVNEDID